MRHPKHGELSGARYRQLGYSRHTVFGSVVVRIRRRRLVRLRKRVQNQLQPTLIDKEMLPDESFLEENINATRQEDQDTVYEMNKD